MGKLSSSGTVRRMRTRKYLLYLLACNVLLVCVLLLFFYTPGINVNVYIENYFVGGKLQSSSALAVVERPGQAPRMMDLVLRRPGPRPGPGPVPVPLLQSAHQLPLPNQLAQAAAGKAHTQEVVRQLMSKEHLNAQAVGPAKSGGSRNEAWAIELELEIK